MAWRLGGKRLWELGDDSGYLGWSVTWGQPGAEEGDRGSLEVAEMYRASKQRDSCTIDTWLDR
jgi:hypothetical protein